MERSLAFTTSSSPPSHFFSNGAFTHSQLHSISSTTPRRKSISIQPIKCSRKTLSGGWKNLSISPIKRPHSSRELDPNNLFVNQRIVFLCTKINDLIADLVISQLLYLDSVDSKKDIKLFINSTGGDIWAGMGIYDGMKSCKADISTVCFGVAESMSAFLLASGTKGKRFCMPNARVMINQPGDGAEGADINTALFTREMNYQNLKMTKILSRITGKPEQQVFDDTLLDNYMNPWEAKEYGLVDAVVDDGKPGLVAPIGDGISSPPRPATWYKWDISGKKLKRWPSEENLVEHKEEAGSAKPV